MEVLRCVTKLAELQILIQFQLSSTQLTHPFRVPAGFLTNKSLTP